MRKTTAVIASGVRVEGSSDVLLRYPVPTGSGQGLQVKVISDIPHRAEARMRADLKQYDIRDVHLRWAPPIPLAKAFQRQHPGRPPPRTTARMPFTCGSTLHAAAWHLRELQRPRDSQVELESSYCDKLGADAGDAERSGSA
jgi:hypothetical protein